MGEYQLIFVVVQSMEIEGTNSAGPPLDDLDYSFKFSPESPSRISEHLKSDITGLSLEREDIQSSWITRDIPPLVTTSNKKQKTSENMKTSNKLEKSRQSARECRARKKLRYQYLDDIIEQREKANDKLRDELAKYVSWCKMLDEKQVPEGLAQVLAGEINDET